MKRQRWGISAARCLGCVVLALIFFVWAGSPALAQVSDSFGVDWDYTTAAVNAPWTAVYNETAGVSAFDANMSNAGTLTVDLDGLTAVGWEGGRSTAPYLATSVPAGKDFTVEVDIVSQTSGFWGAAGLIARGESPTGPGTGADNADESFVTNYSFRTDSALPDVGTTLNKMIQNGNQNADLNVDISAGDEPLPIRLRLERVGGVGYRSWVSTNGGFTYQFQSHVIPAAGNALRDLTKAMEVGLSYMGFTNTPLLTGPAEFDNFSLNYYDPASSPGAPDLSAASSITAQPGDAIVYPVTDLSGQGTLQWIRAPGLPGPDSIPNGLAGAATQTLTVNNFSWSIPGAQAPGIYTTTVTATNDWGESDSVLLTINVIPEPASLALAGLAIVGLVGLFRRRR